MWRRRKQREEEEERNRNKGTKNTLGSQLAAFKREHQEKIFSDQGGSSIVNLSLRRPLFSGVCSSCNPLGQGISSELLKDEPIRKLPDPGLDAQNNDWQRKESQFFKCRTPLQNWVPAILDHPEIRVCQETEGYSEQDIRQKIFLDTHPERSELRRGLQELYNTYPQGIFYHSGQIKVLQQELNAGVPFVFIPQHCHGLRDFFLINAVLFETELGQARYISPDSWHRQEAEVAWGRHDMQEGQQEEYVDYVIKSVTLGKLLETGTHLQFHVQTPAKGGGKMGAYASQVKFNFVIEILHELLMDKVIGDVLMVPVSIAVDLPLGLDQGSARVDFDQPFSFREYITANPDKGLYPHLRSHTIGTSLKNLRIMSTNSLAFLFYVSPNQPMSVQTIVEKFEDIREDLRIDRIDVAFSGETPDVVAYALPLLTQYLSVSVDHGEKSFAFTPLSSGSIIPNLAEPLIRRLSSKAIVATAIKSLVSNDGRSGSFSSLEVLRDTHSEPPTVSREAVLEVASILAHFLELEFYLERCDGSRKHLEESLDALIIAEVVIDTKQREVNCGSHLTEQLSRRLARRFEMENMDAEEQEMSRKIEEPTLALNLRSSALDDLGGLVNLIRPRLQALFAVSRYLVVSFSMAQGDSEDSPQQQSVPSAIEEAKNYFQSTSVEVCEDYASALLHGALFRCQEMDLLVLDGETFSWNETTDLSHLKALRSVLQRFV